MTSDAKASQPAAPASSLATAAGQPSALGTPLGRAAFWLLLVALKLALIFWLPRTTYSDEETYLGLAQRLLSGQGYINWVGQPTAAYIPGYPLLLAAQLRLFGQAPAPHLIINVLLSFVVAWAYGHLLALLTGQRRLACIAAIVIFFFPPYIHYCAHLLTEIPYTATLALTLLFFERTRQQPGRPANWVLLGLFHMISCMIRPVTFLLTPLLLLWPLLEAWGRGENLKRAFTGAVLGGLAILAVWAPWVARNARVFHTFIPLTTGSANALYTGTVTDYVEADAQMRQLLNRHGIGQFGENELAARSIIGEAARRNIHEHPGRYFRLSLGRTWRFWLSEYPGYFFPRRGGDYLARGQYLAVAGKLALHALNAALVLGMVVACWRLRRRRAFWPYILLLVYCTIMHAMLITTARYSVPVTGLAIILIFAAIGHKARSRSATPRAI